MYSRVIWQYKRWFVPKKATIVQKMVQKGRKILGFKDKDKSLKIKDLQAILNSLHPKVPLAILRMTHSEV